MMQKVSEEHTFERQSFEQKFLNRSPVVFRNALKTWPAADWSFESLHQKVGTIRVTVRRYRQNEERSFIQQCIEDTEKISFAQHIDRCLAPNHDSTWSLREGWEVFHRRSELIEDLGFEDVFPNLKTAFAYYLWCGPKDYITGLHADLIDLNLLAHILGEKEILFFSPDQEDALYADDQSAIDGGLYSPVDPFHPDLE